MKYYVIEEIIDYGTSIKISKPLFVVEKEEIAKDVIKRYCGVDLTYVVYDTEENEDE